MFKRILLYIWLVLTLLLDTVWMPMLTDIWLVPLFTPVLLQCCGLLMGRIRGLYFGMIAGLLLDVTVSTPFGFMTVLCAGMGYAGGWFAHYFPRLRKISLICPAVSFLLFELIMDVFAVFRSAQFESVILLRSLARVAIYVALTDAGCFVMDRLLKPVHSRYTHR